jgi:hypothetical protein
MLAAILWVDGSSSTRWKVFLGTTSCCGTAWPVSLGFSGLFDDFAFWENLHISIERAFESSPRIIITGDLIMFIT